MKRKLFLISAVALLLASCTSEEPVSNDPQNPEYAPATSYLSINLRPSSGMGPMGIKAAGTRADEVENPYEEDGGKYEDGSASENDVTRVRFYFFTDGGAPCAVSQNLTTEKYDNFVDWNTFKVDGPNHDETVEKTLTATLGLTFASESEKPAQVLVVANPTNEILYYDNKGAYEKMSSNSMSLGQLQGIVTNYLPYIDSNFVMSNSVYVGTTDPKAVVYTTTLTDDNFKSSPEEAEKPDNVVTIYIERVLARVDFGIDMDEVKLTGVEGTFYEVGTYTLNDLADGNETQGDEAIYVKFLGWNVTSTTATSRLIKDINPDWGNILGTNVPWTTTDYHRSFWALNPEGVKIQYGNFGEVKGVDGFTDINPSGQVANSLEIPKGASFVKTYLQENANPYGIPALAAGPTEPSKVIIAAQLVNSEGAPITICEWGYNKYTLQGLKNQLAKSLPDLYYQDGNDWSQIDADMITFTTEDPIGKNPADKEYYVYAILTEAAAGKTWALYNGQDFTPFSTQEDAGTIESQVNKYIRGIVNHAMIWNTGLTYYFFDIRHLGSADTDAGYVGIVRNHLYRTTVNGIKGLGTPVYDPGKEIHPQNPNPEETVIAAKINILSWRLVTSEYEVGWK